MGDIYVKYCLVCGAENSGFASFCQGCDADLIHANPEPRREESATRLTNTANPLEVATLRVEQAPNTYLEIELVANPSLRFTVQSGQSVGRSSRADVVLEGVPDLEYISRVHARFLRRRAQWYVQYLAEGNSITVDGVESCDDAEIAIYDESIVQLSFTAFRVKFQELSQGLE